MYFVRTVAFARGRMTDDGSDRIPDFPRRIRQLPTASARSSPSSPTTPCGCSSWHSRATWRAARAAARSRVSTSTSRWRSWATFRLASLGRLRAIGDAMPHSGAPLAFDTLGAWRASGVAWVAPSVLPPALATLHATVACRADRGGIRRSKAGRSVRTSRSRAAACSRTRAAERADPLVGTEDVPDRLGVAGRGTRSHHACRVDVARAGVTPREGTVSREGPLPSD